MVNPDKRGENIGQPETGQEKELIKDVELAETLAYIENAYKDIAQRYYELGDIELSEKYEKLAIEEIEKTQKQWELDRKEKSRVFKERYSELVLDFLKKPEEETMEFDLRREIDSKAIEAFLQLDEKHFLVKYGRDHGKGYCYETALKGITYIKWLDKGADGKTEIVMAYISKEKPKKEE